MPDQVVDLPGDLLPDGIGDVLVPGGHVRARPSHQRHHSARGTSEERQHGRSGAPGVVQASSRSPAALTVFAVALFGSKAVSERGFRLLRWFGNRPEPPAPSS
jgi:hypothetical protein